MDETRHVASDKPKNMSDCSKLRLEQFDIFPKVPSIKSSSNYKDDIPLALLNPILLCINGFYYIDDGLCLIQKSSGFLVCTMFGTTCVI